MPKSDPLLEKTMRLRAARLEREKASPPPRAREFNRRPWGLDDELTFGKYKGRTMREVIDEDRGWVVWMLENARDNFFSLAPDAQAEFDASDDPRRPNGRWS